MSELLDDDNNDYEIQDNTTSTTTTTTTTTTDTTTDTTPTTTTNTTTDNSNNNNNNNDDDDDDDEDNNKNIEGDEKDENNSITSKTTETSSDVIPKELSLDEATPSLNQIHPLLNTWKLWFFKQDNQKEWADCFQEIHSFGTIEDFWSTFRCLKPPDRLPFACNYSLFKDGIKPMWEDNANKNGGRWLIQITRGKDGLSKSTTTHWFETIMLLIGEGFVDDSSGSDQVPLSEDICGAVIEIKPKNDRLALWTRDLNKTRQTRIGKILKACLQKNAGLTNFVLFQFFSHSDSSINGRPKVICQV